MRTHANVVVVNKECNKKLASFDISINKITLVKMVI